MANHSRVTVLLLLVTVLSWTGTAAGYCYKQSPTDKDGCPKRTAEACYIDVNWMAEQDMTSNHAGIGLNPENDYIEFCSRKQAFVIQEVDELYCDTLKVKTPNVQPFDVSLGSDTHFANKKLTGFPIKADDYPKQRCYQILIKLAGNRTVDPHIVIPNPTGIISKGHHDHKGKAHKDQSKSATPQQSAPK